MYVEPINQKTKQDHLIEETISARSAGLSFILSRMKKKKKESRDLSTKLLHNQSLFYLLRTDAQDNL